MPVWRGQRLGKGDRRIDACLDHFALMGYAARDVSAVVADLLKVYGGPDAWQFLEEGRYHVVQERLLEIEDEQKRKQDQQLLVEHQRQQDSQQVENEPPKVPDRVLQHRVAKVGTDFRRQVLIQWSGTPLAQATWEDMETLRQRFPHAPAWEHAGPKQGGDTSTSTTQPPSPDNIERDVSQAIPYDATQGTEAEHGPRRGTRVRRPSTWTKGPEWV